MNANKSLGPIPMLTGIALAFALGFLVAKVSPDIREGKAGSRHESGTGSEYASVEPSTGKPLGGTAWQVAKAKVMERWERSPSAVLDFDLREETLRMLEKAPVKDLEVWMRELRPMIHTDWDKNIPSLLREMIIEVLVERRGAEFVRSLAADPIEDGDFVLEDVMDHWTRHDPLAVLQWLDGSDVQETITEGIDDYREDALLALSARDAVEFERRLATLDADEQESVLETYAYRMGSPENRKALLERAAGSSHREAMALWEGLLRREGAGDPALAYKTLAELDLSPADRAALDQSLVFWLMYPASFSSAEDDKGGVMQAWMERNPGELVPEGVRASFERWSQGSPGRAMAWVAGQPSGPRYDVFAAVLAGQRAREPEAVAVIVERIGDTVLRSSIQRELKKTWQEQDPVAAAEWEKGLPEAERERLK